VTTNALQAKRTGLGPQASGLGPRSAALLAALAFAAGCSGTSGSARAAPSAGARTAGAAGPAAAAGEADGLSARAQRLFAEGVQAAEEQRKLKVIDWALLERRWRAALEAAETPEARYNLGVALEAQGRLDEARAEYERARAAKPSLRQAAVNLGVLLEKTGDARSAQLAYASVAREFPEDARSRERLAALYRASGQLDDAWRLAREALLRDPKAVGASKVMARVALQRNQLDVAKLIALRAQKLDPADPELPFLVGEILAREGDDAAAAVQLKKALSLDERYLPARYALLQAAVKGERWGAVAEQAAAILRDRPGEATVHLALGVAQRHLDKPDEALAAYAKAEQLGGGKLPEVHLARGVLFMQVKNECEPAVAEFRLYAQEAGPMAATESPVLKLQRECEAALEENRKALEAAREMQREAERKAAGAAAAKPAPEAGDPFPPTGEGAPTTPAQKGRP
jgi:tetratricopeptide (TPR) repeat protein